MDRDFLEELMASQQAPKRQKRGGLAGIWDRNKNIIKPLATGIVGAIPGLGPIAAAGLGATIGGLDRPGKGGVGLNAGGAVRGGLQGYGAGSLGEMARGGAARLLGRGATMRGPEAAAMERARTGRATTRLSGGREMVSSSAGSTPLDVGAGIEQQTARSSSALGNYVRGGQRRVGRGLRAAMDFTRQNPEAVGAGLQAGAAILSSQAERRMRERELAEDQRRAQNFAMFALPIARETYGGR